MSNLLEDLKEIDGDIQEGTGRAGNPKLEVDEVFELLLKNVSIKKRLRKVLQDIEGISKDIADTKKGFMAVKKEAPPKTLYKAAKGDEVDELLGKWLNEHGCILKIKRLGKGFYMFGEKKIYAKIINGQLVIRVGGGYMGIDEFMKHYGV